ncbi:hypothetical protein Q9233_017187 [Columba guinea]|nr:hypothetical protein Q9233_017187 [Columba guinea]
MGMKEDVQAGRVSWRHDVDIRSWRSSWNFRNVTFYTGRQPPLLTRVAAGGTSYFMLVPFADIRRAQNGRSRENLPFPAFPKCTDDNSFLLQQKYRQICFWEKQPSGCSRISCAFQHSKPRNINGLFLPPNNNVSNWVPKTAAEIEEERTIKEICYKTGKYEIRDGNTSAALNNAKKGGESSGRRVPAERIPRSNWRSFDNGGIHSSDPNGNYQQRRKNKDDETASAVPYVRATSRKTDSDSLEPRRSTYVFYRTVNADQGPKFSGSTATPEPYGGKCSKPKNQLDTNRRFSTQTESYGNAYLLCLK